MLSSTIQIVGVLYITVGPTFNLHAFTIVSVTITGQIGSNTYGELDYSKKSSRLDYRRNRFNHSTYREIVYREYSPLCCREPQEDQG